MSDQTNANEEVAKFVDERKKEFNIKRKYIARIKIPVSTMRLGHCEIKPVQKDYENAKDIMFNEQENFAMLLFGNQILGYFNIDDNHVVFRSSQNILESDIPKQTKMNLFKLIFIYAKTVYQHIEYYEHEEGNNLDIISYPQIF